LLPSSPLDRSRFPSLSFSGSDQLLIVFEKVTRQSEFAIIHFGLEKLKSTRLHIAQIINSRSHPAKKIGKT
jgi:hypothetical protein